MGIFDFIKKIPTQNEIKGSFGDWLAKIYSKTMPGAYVLHDVLIDGAEGFPQNADIRKRNKYCRQYRHKRGACEGERCAGSCKFTGFCRIKFLQNPFVV